MNLSPVALGELFTLPYRIALPLTRSCPRRRRISSEAFSFVLSILWTCLWRWPRIDQRHCSVVFLSSSMRDLRKQSLMFAVVKTSISANLDEETAAGIFWPRSWRVCKNVTPLLTLHVACTSQTLYSGGHMACAKSISLNLDVPPNTSLGHFPIR